MFKIRDYFQELEKRKREENTEKILLEYNSRREKEQLYRLHPFKHVHLIDEEFSYQGPRFISTGYKFNSWNKESPRLADDWCFAVDRLDQLQFAVSEFDQEIEYKWSTKHSYFC